MTDSQMSVAVLFLALWTFTAWAMGYLAGWKEGREFDGGNQPEQSRDAIAEDGRRTHTLSPVPGKGRRP
jgi:hypothetical protein